MYYYALLLYVCFLFLRWVKFCSGCYRQVFFHLGDKKKWSLVALVRWSSYAVMIVWEFAWADSALVNLGEWSSYRGGRLNRFDVLEGIFSRKLQNDSLLQFNTE